MKIAVLTGSVAEGTRIALEVGKSSHAQVWVLVFPVSTSRAATRFLREAYRMFLRRNLFLALRLISKRRVRYFSRPIVDPAVSQEIKELDFDIGLHNLNVIYTRSVIDAFRRGILNSHIGLLPQFRGRCVAEWSLVEGVPTGVTVFFIDENIDTGAEIILREELPTRKRSIRAMKDRLFDVDAEMYRKAIDALASGSPTMRNDVAQGRRYYPMSKLLLSVVETLLKRD